MKIIAHYLPQYHAIPENNKWWGEGYTEWTAVKRAKPLFSGHYQPRKPLHNNYYNLENLEVMEWQADLAKNFGVYGFCFYHYWFNGKLLLEKPAEKMLKSKRPDLPFCFSWANEPWTRTWYGQTNVVLMEQDYGTEKDWEKHYRYLVQFFFDNRYIRINNKPIFLIYRAGHIKPLQRMLDYWNELALKDGLNGIYFIRTLSGLDIDDRKVIFDADYFFEPGYTLNHQMPSWWRFKRRSTAGIKRYINKSPLPINKVENFINYDLIYKQILQRQPPKRKTFLGAFTDWDNSPRRQYSSIVYRGSTPSKYQTYLTKIIEKSKQFNNDFIFINAWNEWGEGAYLEPDEHWEYGYLEAIKNALCNASKK